MTTSIAGQAVFVVTIGNLGRYVIIEAMDEKLSNSISAVLRGETKEFRYIVQEFEKRVFYYFLRMTRDYDEARDLTQNTFIRAYRYIRSYDCSRSFSGWLFSIAHNQLKDLWARKSRDACSLEELEEKYFQRFATDERVVERLEEKNLQEKVRESVLALPELYREVMLLLLIENSTYEEISGITGLPLNTVKIRIHRARKLLKSVLEKWL
ncbi:MAG: sigma-70 family RNA polymerase sigma factor [Candidatus Wallbacteria bacterium]|nr:sigma-70 family RNA polymerase sigma factor [Candidatus Wallbacteria bacterium]